MVPSVLAAGFNVFYVFALNSEVDLFRLILQECRRVIYPVDAAVGVGVWALQDQPVIGHHDFSGCSQVDEEYVTGDAAAGADFVVFSSDWSGSLCDHRAAGHRGGKFCYLSNAGVGVLLLTATFPWRVGSFNT